MSPRIAYAALTAVLVAALALEVAATDTSWWIVVVFLLGPDIALLLGIGSGLEKGQLHPRAVPLYNALHRYWGPAALALASLVLPEGWLAAALAWALHISVDRTVGYGLRTPDGFQQP
jgi:Domain of unknown function (DUF4260)